MKIKALQVGPIGTNCYLLEDETTNSAAVVDPGGEAERILAQLKADGMEVKCILLTHAHFDHTGGVADLRAALPQDAPALQAPPEITVLREVTDDPAYKNRQLAKNQRL